jgi:hypothetical protein
MLEIDVWIIGMLRIRLPLGHTQQTDGCDRSAENQSGDVDAKKRKKLFCSMF